MAKDGKATEWPREIHKVFRDAEIDVVSYVPDGGHKELIAHCHSDERMRTVSLTTEQDGIGLASGAWLGGQRSVMLLQSSGVGNCINALSLIGNCRFPFLMLATMRGDFGESNGWQMAMGQATPTVLSAMGMIILRVEHEEEAAETVRAAVSTAFLARQSVAVLLSQRLIGAKTFK